MQKTLEDIDMKYRVELERKKSANEYQNSRRRVEYIDAECEEAAKLKAQLRCPEFITVSVRKA